MRGGVLKVVRHSPQNAIDTGFLNIYIRRGFTEKE